jgi:bifunctional DNA-binding transcriptional regulator/antitoxin component of YhaV-PrlF toxin-antitoxin module
MKAKTYSYKGRLYTEIPKEAADLLKIKSGDEIDFTSIRDIVFISPSAKQAELKKEEIAKQAELKKEEIELLKKVNSIKHYDRTYNNIVKILESSERKMLDDLFKRDVLFEYSRSGKKLVGLDKKYFQYIIDDKGPIEKLRKEGYLVLEDEQKAKELNDSIKREKLPVRGIRGFDKRYYIVTGEKLKEVENKLSKILTKEKNLKAISSELDVAEDLCKAVLEILLADGEIFEKKRNTYILA